MILTCDESRSHDRYLFKILAEMRPNPATAREVPFSRMLNANSSLSAHRFFTKSKS